MSTGVQGHQLEQLAASARELETAARRFAPQLAGAAATLAERLEGGRFDISVVGEFKRGKSTLLNALLGREVLPTGVLPVTAVATEVTYGGERVVVHHLDGTTHEVGLRELADFVTEEGNPGNRRAVARVEVRVPAGILEAGATLVDTPGLGSVFRHNTEAAREALLRTDGAVVVLSADAPFSDQERELLELLAGRSARTFFVLNRIDHLGPADLDRVRRFVEHRIGDALGRGEPLFCLTARAAVAAKLGDDEAAVAASGFAVFENAFRGFLAEDLVEARLAAARRDVGRLSVLLEDSVAVEEAAARHAVADLDARIARFRAAADEQRRAFDEDRVLLAHATARIGDEVWRGLSSVTRAVPGEAVRRLDEVAAGAPRRGLEDALRDTVEVLVREEFERVRQVQAVRAQEAWRAATAEFRARTQERLDAVRRAAEGIFELRLAELSVPEVAEEEERFFYLFLHLDTTMDTMARGLRRLLPARVVRRRLAQSARRQLVAELDKHAGRARWDLTQRLDAVRLRFEAAMRNQLDDVVEGVLAATERAKERRAELAGDIVAGEEQTAEVRRVISRAQEATAGDDGSLPARTVGCENANDPEAH
jgi:small GTP-binding protein